MMTRRYPKSSFGLAVTALSDLHPASSPARNRALVVLDGTSVVSPFDCIAPVPDAAPHSWILRHEPGAGLVIDPVLAGGSAKSRTIAHWLVRLAAIEERIGLTDAILISVPARSAAEPLLHRLDAQGATVLWPRRVLH